MTKGLVGVVPLVPVEQGLLNLVIACFCEKSLK